MRKARTRRPTLRMPGALGRLTPTRRRGRRWTGYRRAKLRANPICQVPGCRLLATTVDHITPLAEGGAEYDWNNLQSLCRWHAIEKNTQDALRGKRRARGNGPSDR